MVTLIQRVNNRVVSKKYHNKGEYRLFEAYARALSGQSISRFIPKQLDAGIVSVDGNTHEEVFSTKVRNGVTIPVLTSYKEGGTDGGDYKDGGVSVPYCRVSVTLFSDMFDLSDVDEGDTLRIRLKSSNNNVLAGVDVPGLAKAVKDTSSGIQLLLLWDLYVTN